MVLPIAKDSAYSQSRFSRVFANAHTDRATHDSVLMDLGSHVVVPTLGSIIPNWVLIIPKDHHINYASIVHDCNVNPFTLVEDVIARANIRSKNTIWFEHGPIHAGSTMGCGVEHAHIHVLLNPTFSAPDFFDAIESHPLGWRNTNSSDVYRALRKDHRYLVAGTPEIAMHASPIEDVQSQFFRRIIAELAGNPTAWDYKAHPFLNNVATTLRSFERKATAA